MNQVLLNGNISGFSRYQTKFTMSASGHWTFSHKNNEGSANSRHPKKNYLWGDGHILDTHWIRDKGCFGTPTRGFSFRIFDILWMLPEEKGKANFNQIPRRMNNFPFILQTRTGHKAGIDNPNILSVSSPVHRHCREMPLASGPTIHSGTAGQLKRSQLSTHGKCT